jgi:hypothetical protein
MMPLNGQEGIYKNMRVLSESAIKLTLCFVFICFTS